MCLRMIHNIYITHNTRIKALKVILFGGIILYDNILEPRFNKTHFTLDSSR